MLVVERISFSKESHHCGNLIFKEDTPFVDAYITDENVVKLWKKFLHDEDEVYKAIVCQTERKAS